MSKEVDEFIDWRGVAVGVGDTVLYPRVSGRSCEMQEGTVLSIREDGTRTVIERAPTADDPWHYNRISVPQYRVTIKPSRSSRGFYRDADLKAVGIRLGENVTKA